MKDITAINVNEVVSVTKRLKVVNKNYEYRKQIISKFLWWITVYPEGFYQKFYGLGNDLLAPKELILSNNDLYIEGEVVYFKPYLSIRMSNNALYQPHFESEEQLDRYVNKELGSVKLISFQ